jgi:uncharacterized protein
MKLWFSAVAALLFAGPLDAQAFDCTKASTEVEMAICGNVELKTLDDALAKAYAQVKSTSSAAEQKMLVRSQKRWIATREGCPQSEAGLIACVHDETNKRLQLLSGTPESGPGTGNQPMPVFVIQDGSQQAYDLDVQLLRFENPQSRGEKTLNRITEEARNALKLGPHGEDTGGATYAVVQDMSISFASPAFMSVISSYWADTGGAHGNGGVSNYNIGMESGKLMEVSDFFSEDASTRLAAGCKSQIIAEKLQRLEGEPYDPATDDFLKDEVIAEHIATLSRWSFTESKASVSFDAYAIGSYAEGPYDCEFPMTDLKNMALDGAPLP